ncbi:F-box protein PP2-B15-like isoform X2 [Rhodamnia argentea]|uniref:F-box protein PP2-B15-like isoform X2 n=1 Tax=Rhodamnia argentea TaxID=178133 RepID=A0A8B8QIQ3_9MYRT|nr:F-box protein PP2-B15-like isoform X2 [Rhodamnia argentea]
MGMSVRTGMDALPESCVSMILSFTSPAEACRLSLVSSTFLSAAESDVLWARFLPPNHAGIISGSAAPVEFSSKKELFLRLCDRPLLVDGGRKSFKLERSAGTVSFILSARELSIKWSDDPTHWIWKTLPESRFKEVAELRTIDRIEIEGSIETKALSPHTLYGAHLIFKVSDSAFGLDLMPFETSVEMGNWVRPGTARLQCPDQRKRCLESLLYANRSEMLRKHWETERDSRGGKAPGEREDGWMEVELGEFFIGEVGDGDGDGDGEVKMSLKQVKGYQLKGGLVVEGIEVRPKSPVH